MTGQLNYYGLTSDVKEKRIVFLLNSPRCPAVLHCARCKGCNPTGRSELADNSEKWSVHGGGDVPLQGEWILDVIDIKEFFTAEHEALLSSLMVENVISFSPEGTMKQAADAFVLPTICGYSRNG
jgi:hypothetical protein